MTRFAVLHALVLVAIASAVTGCAVERVPPTDPHFAAMSWADVHYRLPEPFAGYSVTSMRAVPADGKLLIAAALAGGDEVQQVVLLCDSELRQAQLLLRANRRVVAVAASADGKLIAIRSENSDIAQNGGSIQLIDVNTPASPKMLDADIAWGPGLEFSQAGHLLAASDSRDRLVKLWDLDSGRMCTLTGRAELQISFLDSTGYVICNTGDAIELSPWKSDQPARWGRHARPSWDAVAFDQHRKLAIGGISFGSGAYYVPAKAVGFDPRTRAVVGRWTLPYPESDEVINTMASVRMDLMMIAQPSRIALHDATLMNVKVVLGAHADSIDNAVYLPANDAIYASSGQTIVCWHLGKLRF